MKRGALVLLCMLTALSSYTFSQQAGHDLTAEQRLGRQLFAQNCGVCHLRPSFNVRTYGPMLNKTSSGGDAAAMRKAILDGTQRMPAFKYHLQTTEIDAIVAYLMTVPVQAPPTPQKQQPGAPDDI